MTEATMDLQLHGDVAPEGRDRFEYDVRARRVGHRIVWDAEVRRNGQIADHLQGSITRADELSAAAIEDDIRQRVETAIRMMGLH